MFQNIRTTWSNIFLSCNLLRSVSGCGSIASVVECLLRNWITRGLKSYFFKTLVVFHILFFKILRREQPLQR